MTGQDPILNLAPFRTAKTLAWKRWTVFEPHRVDDGTLFAFDDDGKEMASLPLDTYSEAAGYGVIPLEDQGSPITRSGVGIVWVDPETVEDVHAAVRAWCKARLGRDDVEFQQ